MARLISLAAVAASVLSAAFLAGLSTAMEVPLLIEMGTHRDCDVVVVVSALPETQVARSVARASA